MQASRAADALAKASAALIDQTDAIGFLAALLSSSTEVLQTDASGILVENDGHLDVLAASSHSAVELELLQAMLSEGPCIEAYASGRGVDAHGPELHTRWPTFGRAMTDFGFSAVRASPLRWRGKALGAMGLFRRANLAFTPEEQTVAQAFADLVTLLIVQSEQVDLDALESRVHVMLTGRIVIEQAKGVLAEIYGVDLGKAYELLLLRAADGGGNLTATAQTILDEVQQGLT